MCGTIGECFLVADQQVKLVINSASKRAVLAFVHLNADLWTSKVSHQKFLGVRIFCKSGPEFLVVIKWYGVEHSYVNGATSDAGSDCKKAFHKLAQEHGWM